MKNNFVPLLHRKPTLKEKEQIKECNEEGQQNNPIITQTLRLFRAKEQKPVPTQNVAPVHTDETSFENEREQFPAHTSGLLQHIGARRWCTTDVFDESAP